MAKLLAYDLGLSGVAFASQPLEKMKGAGSEKILKRAGSASQVSIRVTVGSGGSIEMATLGYQVDGTSLTYKVTCRELGSAPTITAPDPDHTTTLA